MKTAWLLEDLDLLPTYLLDALGLTEIRAGKTHGNIRHLTLTLENGSEISTLVGVHGNEIWAPTSHGERISSPLHFGRGARRLEQRRAVIAALPQLLGPRIAAHQGFPHGIDPHTCVTGAAARLTRYAYGRQAQARVLEHLLRMYTPPGWQVKQWRGALFQALDELHHVREQAIQEWPALELTFRYYGSPRAKHRPHAFDPVHGAGKWAVPSALPTLAMVPGVVGNPFATLDETARQAQQGQQLRYGAAIPATLWWTVAYRWSEETAVTRRRWDDAPAHLVGRRKLKRIAATTLLPASADTLARLLVDGWLGPAIHTAPTAEMLEIKKALDNEIGVRRGLNAGAAFAGVSNTAAGTFDAERRAAAALQIMRDNEPAEEFMALTDTSRQLLSAWPTIQKRARDSGADLVKVNVLFNELLLDHRRALMGTVETLERHNLAPASLVSVAETMRAGALVAKRIAPLAVSAAGSTAAAAAAGHAEFGLLSLLGMSIIAGALVTGAQLRRQVLPDRAKRAHWRMREETRHLNHMHDELYKDGFSTSKSPVLPYKGLRFSGAKGPYVKNAVVNSLINTSAALTTLMHPNTADLAWGMVGYGSTISFLSALEAHSLARGREKGAYRARALDSEIAKRECGQLSYADYFLTLSETIANYDRLSEKIDEDIAKVAFPSRDSTLRSLEAAIAEQKSLTLRRWTHEHIFNPQSRSPRKQVAKIVGEYAAFSENLRPELFAEKARRKLEEDIEAVADLNLRVEDLANGDPNIFENAEKTLWNPEWVELARIMSDKPRLPHALDELALNLALTRTDTISGLSHSWPTALAVVAADLQFLKERRAPFEGAPTPPRWRRTEYMENLLRRSNNAAAPLSGPDKYEGYEKYATRVHGLAFEHSDLETYGPRWKTIGRGIGNRIFTRK
ncbi:MAG: hypothetical protein HOQ05_14145 [Corynebacteriales bacterium]|nr:hypothetical protein [Mycobacteriales bacterium]